MDSKKILDDIIKNYQTDKFIDFFREKSNNFSLKEEELSEYNDDKFSDFKQLGDIIFSEESESLIIITVKALKELSEKSSKKAQYEKAKKILKDLDSYDAGIFIYYDVNGSFRFSLICPQYSGKQRSWNNFRRYTYFVDKDFTNKTFLNQIGGGSFNSLDSIKESFSLAKVTKDFYNDFYPLFQKISESVKLNVGKISTKEKEDFTLLFVIRVIFLGFIQKRKWLGADEKFLQSFWNEYEEKFSGQDNFYLGWLKPLFFEALNSPYGKKVAYQDNDFAEETEKKLQLAPYLNGGLFQEKEIDRQGCFVPDNIIKDFFDFLFSYNFTIEENTLYDEELELNPEFLGIIFERLVNKADGAVYTPRTEVDLMCRLSLVKWLNKNNTTEIDYRDLYELFFIEQGKGKEYNDQQKTGSFSEKQYKDILNLLEQITICDPAVGSGAFPVGILQIIDEIEEYIYDELKIKNISSFERKKRIIGKSLYGVEVKEWAVWITQLRLWITLFIEAPEDLKQSLVPILPSLDFKIRHGDSLVQKIGSKIFPVSGHAFVSQKIKRKVTELKNLKVDYYYNKKDAFKKQEIEQRELQIYCDILDDEIKIFKDELKGMKENKDVKQISLFGVDKISGDSLQDKLNFNKAKVDELVNKINELEEQKKLLRKNKPLVWNIEFAEIFVERGGFDLVIGNPPYINYKQIKDSTNTQKDPISYKKSLKQMVNVDFPGYFSLKNKIDGKSDIYIYFYIRALRLLNPDGFLTFICSSSWLDVGFGVHLQKFLLDRSPVELIIDNHAKRSFGEADVNTIISIIQAPCKKVDENHLVKFVAFKKPFEETIFTENLLSIEREVKINSTDSFRVYPVSIKDLKEFGTEYENEEQEKINAGKYIGEKWGGTYLRSPQILLDIFEKNIEKFIKISKDKNLLLKTGVKEGGYSDYIKDKNLLNSSKFINYIPIIKNVKKHKKPEIKNVDSYIIKKVEHFQKTTKNKKADLLWLSGRGWTHKCQINLNHNIFSGNYIGIDVKNNKTDFYFLLFNSTIIMLISEVINRGKGIGGAACVFTKSDLLNLNIPKLSLLNFKKFKPFLKNYKKREFKNIFEECGIDPKSDIPIEEQDPKPLPDRVELDKIVFDALKLSEDERVEVYRAVCRLVWNRISKARSV